MVTENQISITKHDGSLLKVHVFEPTWDLHNKTAVVINPALGLVSRYYHAFSRFLAQNGYKVLTYNYSLDRDVPGNTKVDLNYWAKTDFKSVLNYTEELNDVEQIYIIGHSIGGTILGLTELSNKVSKIILVATQNGYWKLWPGFMKYFIWYFSRILIPIVSNLLGYLPGKLFGMSTNVPKGVALEWAYWARNKHFLERGLPGRLSFSFKDISCPILWYSMDDDILFAPKSAVDSMVTFFSNAQIQRNHLVPINYGLKRISHVGIFAKTCQGTIWDSCLSWLNSSSRLKPRSC